MAEATAIGGKLKAEAAGLTEKAAAMAALDEASRTHEEYRLRLEAEKDIRLAGLDVQRQVAEAQAALRGTLTTSQAARWSEVTTAYLRTQALGSAGEDPLTPVVAALGLLADGITAVETAITRATDPRHLLARPVGRHAAGPAEASR